ncbi:MAG: tripartite tricarboxylate transporter substrate binding protein [Polaromonas sp.]|nr:tripartite tricarboxylate transporter substrate binding protein [Polaromonas sp.]
MNFRRTFLGAVLALPALWAFSAPAAAQTGAFPNRPLRMIIPFGAGSGVDANGRFFAEQLARQLGQPVVVDNRPGADGAIGMVAVKNAPADGYTLLLASNSSLTVNPVVIKNLPYDPVKDFKPVSGLTRGMTVLVVPAGSPYNTLAELLAGMKKAPTPVAVGTYSSGYRLAVEGFADLAGVKFTNIPYKGAAPMFTDLIGNRLDWAMTDLIGAAELLRSGKLKAIAVTGDSRHEDFPAVPTVRESGPPAFAGYANYTWASLSIRADTPEDVTARLADALQKTFTEAGTRDFLKRAKVELMPHTPAEQQQFQRAETERLRRIADAAGIKPE